MNESKPTFLTRMRQWFGLPQSHVFHGTDWLNNAWAPTLDSAGQRVSESTVLSLSAAWACVRLISETIATLPVQVYERTDDGRRVAREHPLYYALHNAPNPDSTATMYWEAVVSALLLRGTAWSKRLTIGGRLVGLQFLSPWRLSVTYVNGQPQLRYTDFDGSIQILDQRDLFKITGFSLDGRNGLSAISYGASVFGGALAANAASNGTFERGLMPTVAFSMEAVLKKEQRAEFRENLQEMVGAMNAGKSPLLEGGMKADTIGINPNDAQLLESRGFSVEEICRWFRVDPSMVGHGNAASNWGTGLEQKMQAFLTFTLRPWLTRIEQAINTWLLSPADRQRYYVEFSFDALLRADSAARASFYSILVNNGIFTRDEVRQLENKPTLGGNAGVLTVQSAMIPLDKLDDMGGKAPAPETTK